MERASTIFLDCKVTFDRLNALLTQQGPIEAPGNVNIEKIKLSGDAGRLIAEASVKGPYNGKAVLHCTPGFNNADKRFTLEDLDISLPDDGILAKLAEKMINNLFNAKLDSKLEALINEKFLSLFEEIVAQLRKVTLPKGGTLHFDTQSFNLDRLTTDASGLQFVAELTGVAAMEY